MGHPVRYLTDDEVGYIEKCTGKYSTEAVAKQVHLNPKILITLAKKLNLSFPRAKKREPKPPVFTGESSFVADRCCVEVPKKPLKLAQPRQKKTHKEQFANPLFKVDFSSREVLVDRISEYWGC